VTVPDERHVKLTGDDIPFTALLDWLNTARAAHGLRVEAARIEARPEPGRVRASLTLVRS
jgi:type II secretory pathway component PulM